MGAPAQSECTSLDRLKALDTLPDLDAQLAEARSLCNHAARAEMITKWLLGMLKSQEEARDREGSWELLSSCCRLLSLQKIAILLGTNGFIDILQTTFAASNLASRPLSAIGRTVDLLFELAGPTHGAAIKSFLSTTSSTAATICGKWLHNVRSLGQKGQEDTSTNSLYSSLGAALQLWMSRKPSAQDDELFNSSCLVNALLLISKLRSSDSPVSTKRNRSGEHVNAPHADSLERLIAKHTILPARAAFFKHRQPQSRKPRGTAQDEEPSSINERVGSLKMAIWSDSDKDALRTVPLLLDIALRSKSAPTPRDRLNERPWLEELWTALRGCFANQDRNVKNGTLAALLQVIRQQSTTLSQQMLSTIVKEDAVPSDDSSDSIDWRLVARVVDLDAAIFNDRTLAQTLFDHITADSVSVARGGDDGVDIRNEIAVPVMRAFGRSRSLRRFIDFWGEQLQQEQNFQPQSIWNNMSSSFADLLEESLPQQQILTTIHESVSSLHESAALSTSRLNTTFVTLEALLQGVRADSTLIKLSGELDNLLRDLFTIVELEAFEVHKDLPVQLWRLLSRVVIMWYPLWASKQQDQDAIGDQGAGLLARKTFKTALAQSMKIDMSSDSSKLTARAARAFIVTICGFFKDVEHKQCKLLCAEAIDALSSHDVFALDTFIAQPGILSNIESVKRKKLFSAAWRGADDSADLDQVRAVIAASRSNDGRAVLDDVVAVLQKRANQYERGSSDILLSSTQNIGSTSLTRAHRVDLLDVLMDLGDKETNELPNRVAMMLELASPPCLEAKLFDDASSLWKIVSSFDASVAISADLTATLILLEELVACVLKAWLATHQRQRSRELLADLSIQLLQHTSTVSFGQSKTSAANCAAVAVIKTAIRILESDNGTAVSKDLPHRESKHMKAYIRRHLDEADTILAFFEEKDTQEIVDPSTTRSLECVLEALASTPGSIWQLSGQSSAKACEIARRAIEVVSVQGTDTVTTEMTGGNLVACFHSACKFLHDDPAQLTRLGHSMLQRKLDAVEYRNILAKYETVLKSLDHDEKLQVLSQFKADFSLTSLHSLALQRVALHSLNTEDIEADRATLTATFHDVLEAASKSRGEDVQKAALSTLVEMIKERAPVVNQYAVERTIAVMVQLLKSSSNTGVIYANACNVLSALFAHHRSRLQGRFHLVVALLQALTSGLFQKSIGSNEAAIRHARSLSRLLETFCNPPQARHSKKSSHLVDEARKAQAHAGQVAQYLLHHYCNQVLIGTLGEGVRDALSPGLWAIIEAIEVNNAEGIKSLSAAMNNSERAVLRSVYEDWKRFGKWEGT